MNIGIIGAGNVGGTLGKRWAQKGHIIVFASRDPHSDEMKTLVEESGTHTRSATIADTVKACDLLLLATPWNAVEAVLRGAGNLQGKILIDATNPLKPTLDGLAVGMTTSAGEMVAEWAAGAKVVKAFNTVGFNIMANSHFDGARVAMFCCGDDAEAKKVVITLAEQLGFEGLDAGPLTQARLLEPLALLWISLALRHGFGREIGFELLRR
jgi:predicted dinucleotide-binding enzyme